MKRLRTGSYLLISVLAIGLYSCGGENKKANDSGTIQSENIEAEIRKVVYPLPSAKEVTDMLNEINADYIIGLPNDPLNSEKYSMESIQALNLGIYGTDLSYASTYRQQSVVTSYVKSCEILIKSLDITSSFGSDLLDRIERNIDNKEALTKEISDMFQYTYGSLVKEKKTELASLILGGSWIEGMYLTTNIIENTVQNSKMVATVLFQKESLDLLLKNMKQYKDSPLCENMYSNLLEIKAIFNQNPDANSITQTELENLTTKVAEIRDKIVKI